MTCGRLYAKRRATVHKGALYVVMYWTILNSMLLAMNMLEKEAMPKTKG